MRLVVQVPAYNEAKTLPEVIRTIPRQIPGVDEVLVLVIDDGSTDGTAAVAAAAGADFVLRHPANRGLAAAFQTGLDFALRLGADIIVNTDGDNQYPQAEIPRLIEPILQRRADIVIGDRQVKINPNFRGLRRLLQQLGSRIVSSLSRLPVADAPSGFRAYSREAALRLQVVSRYSYTLETLIQAGHHRLAVESVPILTNPPTRPSRLMRGLADYLVQSGLTLIRVYAMHEPFKVFGIAAAVLAAVGLVGIGRFLYFFTIGQGGGHIQSLILSGVLLVIAFQVGLVGLAADLIAANRRLLEEALFRLKVLELEKRPPEEDTLLWSAGRQPLTKDGQGEA